MANKTQHPAQPMAPPRPMSERLATMQAKLDALDARLSTMAMGLWMAIGLVLLPYILILIVIVTHRPGPAKPHDFTIPCINLAPTGVW
jgi:hypothetical protein